MNAAYPKLLTPDELAELLQLTTDQVSKLRIKGNGPPFVKLGRQVRYVPAAVAKWLEAQQQTSTRPPQVY